MNWKNVWTINKKKKILHTALDKQSQLLCVIASSSQSKKSSIAAPMTVKLNFDSRYRRNHDVIVLVLDFGYLMEMRKQLILDIMFMQE